MRKRILTTTIFAVLAIGLLFMPTFAAKAQAADKSAGLVPFTRSYPTVFVRVSESTIRRPMVRT